MPSSFFFVTRLFLLGLISAMVLTPPLLEKLLGGKST